MTPRTRLVIGGVLAAAVAAGSITFAMASGKSDGAIKAAKSGTSKYHNIGTAKADGYGELVDKAKIACIDKAGEGAMGIHYVKGALVEDAAEQASTPEALIYEPQSNGQLQLVAVEYVVTKPAWDAAGNTAPPALFGKEFKLVSADNRFGLPAFYALHAWIWKNNPSGKFADYNPKVSCTT